MKRYLPFLLLFFLFPLTVSADEADKIAALLKQANAHELVKLFAVNEETTVLDDPNVYSKAESEAVLNKFFSQNKPRSVKILHRVNSNAKYRFAVFILETNKGAYRVAITLKEASGNLMIIELRIGAEKVK